MRHGAGASPAFPRRGQQEMTAGGRAAQTVAMPLGALLLVLFAAVCHSTWNLLVKADARRLEIQSGALVVGTLICAPVLLRFSPWELTGLAWAMIALSAM